ncbi:EAL domain-containing protein, partial [Thiolapillus sp.]
YFFDPVQDRRVHARREYISRIAEAIEKEELQLFYQPKVDMVRGRIFGAEALVRWQHPEQGLLPPNMFLPLIEGHRLQYALDWWVLRTAIRQAALWHADGLDLVVGINVSPSTIQYPDFTSQLMQLVDEENISTDLIELEIVESDAIDDLDAVSAVIHQCEDVGVHFALDDYGTGYSSLTYIRRLPVQTLKIDQIFVKDILTDQDDLNIVEGVIGLARAFGREMIAEGVENTEIGVRLLELGCNCAQGYGIAKPMPFTEIPAWVRQYRFPSEWIEVAKKLSAA